MRTNSTSFLDKLAHNPRKLFLIDSLGALLTASLLLGVVAHFEAYFGMPRPLVYFLSVIPCIFIVYSMSCYFWVGSNWRPFLKGIAIANLLYCCLTLVLVGIFFGAVTALAILYFAGEAVVVGGLVFIELRTAFHRT